MNISAEYDQKNKEIIPELKLKDQFEQGGDLSFSINKEKVYAELNVKF